MADFLFNYGTWVLTPLHVLVCLILIAVVLLQTGKGTDWAGVFGGAGTQTAFGPRGVENTLSRLTKIAAVVFMVTSLALSLLQSKGRREGGLFKQFDEDVPATGSPSPSPTGMPLAPTPVPLEQDGIRLVPLVPEATGTPQPAPATSPGP